MNYLSNAGLYIVDTLLGLYILLVLVRFWLHWVRGSFVGPIGEMLILVTTPVIKPFKSFAKSPTSWALICLLVAYALTVIKNIVMVKLAGAETPLVGALVYSAGELIRTSIYIFIVSIFISIIVSWVAPHGGNPMLHTIRSLSEPILLPARRLIPSFGGMDLSPIATLFLLNLTLILVAAPVTDLGNALGFPLR